jgi:hypothetical protein
MGQVDVGNCMDKPIDDRARTLKAPTVVRYAGGCEANDTVERTRRGTGSALRRAYPAPGAAPEDMLRLLRRLDE